MQQEKINPKGGAIAFGHPLGCTGARQVSTLLTELKRTGKKIGVTSMCVGTGESFHDIPPLSSLILTGRSGMGMAAVWVQEG